MVQLLNVVVSSKSVVRILLATDFNEPDANNCEMRVDLGLRTVSAGGRTGDVGLSHGQRLAGWLGGQVWDPGSIYSHAGMDVCSWF